MSTSQTSISNPSKVLGSFIVAGALILAYMWMNREDPIESLVPRIKDDNKKYVKHDGTHFKSDEEAQKFAKIWCSKTENSGWVYKGKHKMEINNKVKTSYFEVVKTSVQI